MGKILVFNQPTKTTDFDGPCPFLTCSERGPHSHSTCPKCGAVKYGNANCDECRKHWDHPNKLTQQS
jgi:hypothetical protein